MVNSRWPQQEIFCARVKEFARREGLVTKRGAVIIESVAARFDLSPKTLKQFLQNKKRPRPHYETLAAIALVMGCDVREFLDRPSEPPPGIDSAEWAEASEKSRVLMRIMFSDFVEFTESEQELMFEFWKKGIQIRQLPSK